MQGRQASTGNINRRVCSAKVSQVEAPCHRRHDVVAIDVRHIAQHSSDRETNEVVQLSKKESGIKQNVLESVPVFVRTTIDMVGEKSRNTELPLHNTSRSDCEINDPSLTSRDAASTEQSIGSSKTIEMSSPG